MELCFSFVVTGSPNRCLALSLLVFLLQFPIAASTGWLYRADKVPPTNAIVILMLSRPVLLRVGATPAAVPVVATTPARDIGSLRL